MTGEPGPDQVATAGEENIGGGVSFGTEVEPETLATSEGVELVATAWMVMYVAPLTAPPPVLPVLTHQHSCSAYEDARSVNELRWPDCVTVLLARTMVMICASVAPLVPSPM